MYTLSPLLTRSLITSIMMLSTASSALALAPTSPPVSAQALGIPNGGWFQKYFDNIISGGNCPLNQVVGGFITTPDSTYGTRKCIPVSSMLASLFSGVPTNNIITGYSATGPTYQSFSNLMQTFLGTYTSGAPGQVVTGFNSTTGLPTYGAGSPWQTSGTDIYYNAGNVGIGTNTPTTKLDVVGAIKVGNSTVACSALLAGVQRYNTATKEMEFCDGTKYVSMAGGGGYAPGSIEITTPGPFTFTVPTGVRSLQVEIWGGGGGGGPSTLSLAYCCTWNTTGGGGGGSGYKTYQTLAVSPGQVISGVVGAGGAGGIYVPPGAPPPITYGGLGSTTTFSGMIANGGQGGRNGDFTCGGGSCNGEIFCYTATGPMKGPVWQASGGNPGMPCTNKGGNPPMQPGSAGGAALPSVFPGVIPGGKGGGLSTAVYNGNAGSPGDNGKVYIKW